MSRLVQWGLSVWLLTFGPTAFGGSFTSLYAFGDGVCTTTNSPGGSMYYGQRYCNGRVWIEVLCERLGITYDADKNWSFFGHYSPNLVANLNNFAAPPDAATALFLVWVADADFVYAITQYAPYTANNLATWTNAINLSLSNHWVAIEALYQKGARTLILPNAVDLTRVPFYNGLAAASKSFIRQRVLDFNLQFAALIEQAQQTLPDLRIVSPDIFQLLENFVVYPADYGLTSALANGQPIDALSDPALSDKSLAGPGADYLFWDYLDPSARAQAVIADVTLQLLAPARITALEPLGASNQLTSASLPIGLSGWVEESTDLVHWNSAAFLSSTSDSEIVLLPADSPARFYRLRFPFAWSWP